MAAERGRRHSRLFKGDPLVRVVAAAKLTQTVIAEVPGTIQAHARQFHDVRWESKEEKGCGTATSCTTAPRCTPIALYGVRTYDRATGDVLDNVVVLDVAMQFIVGADAKPELHVTFVELALTPEEEVRALVLHITAARAPRKELKQVRDDRARVTIPVAVHGATSIAALELDLAAGAHATPHWSPHTMHSTTSRSSVVNHAVTSCR